jgi:hypothetical protein
MTTECPHCGSTEVTVEQSLAVSEEPIDLVVPEGYADLVDGLAHKLVEAEIIDCDDCNGQWERIESTGALRCIFPPHAADLVDCFQRVSLAGAFAFALAHAPFTLVR